MLFLCLNVFVLYLFKKNKFKLSHIAASLSLSLSLLSFQFTAYTLYLEILHLNSNFSICCWNLQMYSPKCFKLPISRQLYRKTLSVSQPEDRHLRPTPAPAD